MQPEWQNLWAQQGLGIPIFSCMAALLSHPELLWIGRGVANKFNKARKAI